jgi:hypothetical protein
VNWRSLYSGRTFAASAPWPTGSAIRFAGGPCESGPHLFPLSSLSTGGISLAPPIFRDSFRMWPRRSFGNEREPSQPQPEHEARPAASGRRGRRKANGRAADEAAARRTMAGLPFSGCESGRLREAPIGTESLRARGTDQAGHRTFGFRTSPAESGISVSASPPAETGFGPDRSGRTGFRPGSCETADPGFRSMDCQADPRPRPRIPPVAEPRASALRNREGGERNASSKPPSGEPPGLRPWSGSQRGHRKRLRPRTDSGRKRQKSPRLRRRFLETAQRGTPRLPGRVLREGTVGAGGNAGPH